MCIWWCSIRSLFLSEMLKTWSWHRLNKMLISYCNTCRTYKFKMRRVLMKKCKSRLRKLGRELRRLTSDSVLLIRLSCLWSRNLLRFSLSLLIPRSWIRLSRLMGLEAASLYSFNCCLSHSYRAKLTRVTCRSVNQNWRKKRKIWRFNGSWCRRKICFTRQGLKNLKMTICKGIKSGLQQLAISYRWTLRVLRTVTFRVCSGRALQSTALWTSTRLRRWRDLPSLSYK